MLWAAPIPRAPVQEDRRLAFGVPRDLALELMEPNRLVLYKKRRSKSESKLPIQTTPTKREASAFSVPNTKTAGGFGSLQKRLKTKKARVE